MIISKKELYEITGGSTKITATMINSVSKIINTLLDLGRTIGSAIRYGHKKISC